MLHLSSMNRLSQHFRSPTVSGDADDRRRLDRPNTQGMTVYEEETRGVIVRVTPDYREDQSAPDEDRFVWAYTVEIENRGGDRVQLMARQWEITDARGRRQEVRGAGVVGEQPVLEPGERFRYTSGAPLATPSGLMRGAYEMRLDTGERFCAQIPAFSLDSPHDPASRRPN